MQKRTFLYAAILFSACNTQPPVAKDALKPAVVTEVTPHDTDDPAIWIHPTHPDSSLIIGTDKDSDGGLYVYDLSGKMLREKTVRPLKRPNNVDIVQNVKIGGKTMDIAVATERETNSIRIFSVPDMRPLDNGGIEVFTGEQERGPMGVALYHNTADSAVYAIVGRKFGPKDAYLWQYKLEADAGGNITGTVVRKFGKFMGGKEIESIAVDAKLGYIYYSDEGYGVHKYHADPAKGNEELAVFGLKEFKEDVEGISIYQSTDSTGYIIVSNQQENTFNFYPREGVSGNVHQHTLIGKLPFSTVSSDGSEVTSVQLGNSFPKGVFVAMSEGMVFHYYDWRDIEKRLLKK